MRRNSGVIAGILLLSHMGAQAAITEFDQKALLYSTNYGRGVNWQAQGGVAAPSGATARQFQGALVYGAVSYQRLHPGTLIPGTNFNGQAEILDWPRSKPGDSLRVVLRLQAGAPYLSRQVSLFFGSAIPTPETDESGNLLSEALRATYWNPEPHSTNGHSGAQYYWSPSARRVFAIQPGSVEVVWRKATPDATSHPGDTNYFALGGNYFRLFSRRYVVSGNAVKTPRTIFWTEGVYGPTGKKVEVPEGRVKDVKFVYNNTFPAQVSPNQLVQPYPGPITPESTNTVWLQNGRFISAYNLEGRVFLELLGDGTASGVREHLGFEILDVKREAIPEDVVTELGERLTSYPNNVPSDAELTADPMDPAAGAIFAYQHSGGTSGRVEHYAIQTTRNRSDLQMYWMEAGEQGIRWPLRLARYKLVWPDDVAKYSHYVRPPAQTDAEARATAVPFSTANVPKIEFQDRDGNSRERAGLTDEFRFYTWLDATIPTHRTLLRFTAGNNIAFERVFSWLDENLRAGTFQNTIATNLSSWDPVANRFNWSETETLNAPRVVNEQVWVGQRLEAPGDETRSTLDWQYLAGYVQRSEGTGYSVSAYRNPFEVSFEEAAKGAIIPVNARNDNAVLEVWWFRPNHAQLAAGFQTIYWPSAIGRYSVRWPTGAPHSREIILASNDGSGGLGSLEAKGAIYFQNNPDEDGYNPNEEHALMQGGQVYALRDDLNQIAPNSYSSHPYVLLEYADSSGRPGMTVFRVLREKGEETFDYSITAGTILQAPMPLPLMPLPFGPRFIGAPPRSLNTEIATWQLAGLAAQETPLYSATEIETTQPHAFRNSDKLALQLNLPASVSTEWFYVTSSIPNLKIVRGVISPAAPAAIEGSLRTEQQPADLTRWRYLVADVTGFVIGGAAVIRNDAVGAHWLGVITETNSLSAGTYYVEISFTQNRSAEMQEATSLAYPLLTGITPNRYDGWRISYVAAPPGITDTAVRNLYQRFTIQDRKGNLWVYRGPHSPMDSPNFVSRFYYKTLPGFYFPSLPFQSQPAIGTISPYLRQWDAAQSTYLGDPVGGDLDNDGVEDGNALAIRYSPVWPENVPVLHMAETLTLPKRGLPAVRGQKSLEILYQQSQSTANNLNGDLAAKSVVLHDPTREKEFQFARLNDPILLDRIPDSVKTNAYRGHGFFPNLPPHLVERVFVDPNRGGFGALVFSGQFFDAPLGDDFLLLNVLTPSDKDALEALCLGSDERKERWDSAIDGLLRTTMQLFVENPAKPGTYMPTQPRVVNPHELAEVSRDDVAVDSYALTAVGPKTGYITLIAGNGLAFTPVEEPVSIHIVKVTDALYRGELKVVQSSNPLNEKLTLQQVVDLAGKGTNDYEFEWLITAPVDGAPPPVYENVRASLLQDGSWTHIQHPLVSDSIAGIRNTLAARQSIDINGGVVAITAIPFQTVQADNDRLVFVLRTNQTHTITSNNELVVRDRNGNNYPAIVSQVAVTTFSGIPATRLTVQPASDIVFPGSADVLELFESALPGQRQSIAFRQFTVPAGRLYTQYYLSIDLDSALGARVYLDGVLVATANLGTGDTPTTAAPNGFSALPLVYQLGSDQLNGGQNLGLEIAHTIAVEFFSSALPGAAQLFNLRLEAYEAIDRTAQPGSPWLALDPLRFPEGVRAILGENADVRSLSDNYLIMRYRARDPNHASYKPDLNGEKQGWSLWTEPQLAEGWIKRVLAGINPFNQRITHLFNNRVNTDVSILTQAGQRWEGDIALNLDAINNFGLIEIYETVLRRGKDLSINSGINYGPANDALLLAAGYLNDLYMMLGNEAWTDAANPTIGIGTKDKTYGEIATALFAFRGQVPSLLEEELALLRGRDDFLQPGVETAPVYNRMVWNYTRGIDAGEVIYALNYNIQENNDTGVDGVINADDARKMFPQGHGDAYGHYLTALKGYYELFLDADFDWVPRTEAVTVLGKAVQVDYQDERKFAAAAAALARAGRQIFDLTWRRDYVAGDDVGWEHLSSSRENTRRFVPSTRFWGADHWASRTMQGDYYNWALGNALLPEVDPDPLHEGIQKVDRTTVPELKELPATAQDLQSALDNADAHLTPLGLPAGGLAFDISPLKVTGIEPETHFEQLYGRAKVALQNALTAFDDAKDVTRLLRSEQDSLAEFQAGIGRQELAYTNALIELYGSPYPDDVGPGRTFKQGYSGPDLIHYMYVDNVDLRLPALSLDASIQTTYKLDIQSPPSDWINYVSALNQNPDYLENRDYITFTLDSHGFYSKPSAWTSRRPSPGKVQDAIAAVILAHNGAASALESQKDKKYILDRRLDLLKTRMDTHQEVEDASSAKAIAQTAIANAEFGFQMLSRASEIFNDAVVRLAKQMQDAIPDVQVFGLANGGDLFSAAKASIDAASSVQSQAERVGIFAKEFTFGALKVNKETLTRFRDAQVIQPLLNSTDEAADIYELDALFTDLQNSFFTINERVQELDDAVRRYRALLAQGDRIQQEREIFRQRSAAIIQGFRTRDAAFRLFRTEKLERYKTLFDLAARYAYLAANAYDYETGLLNTQGGKEFLNRIVNSRALGVVRNGEPEYAGSSIGDPGLSSALAEMKADWTVLKGRLGFNNEDGYGTTVSLRTEKERIVKGSDGHAAWKDVLQRGRIANLLDDQDVRRNCLQIERGGLPVPGIIVEFSTTIADGQNLFGRNLAGGDHNFPSSAFATKIFGVGVAFEGYQGMDNPVANLSAINVTGAQSPPDADTAFLGTLTLAATPGVYLIPVGLDLMRVPPLGEAGDIRSWIVNDVTVPLPFNIGDSDFSSTPYWQSGSSLTEPLFAIRKHQEFRPVSTTDAFSSAIYGDDNHFQVSQFTNNRLIGRSVWNTKWKLIIPGHKLLHDPEEGLDRFIETVRDIKLHFVTYSYSGN